MANKDLKAKIGVLEEAFPGQVTRAGGTTTVTVTGEQLEEAAERAREGHNSGDTLGADRLRLLIERIERLEQDKKDVGDDIKDVFAEVKAVGYCAKTVRKIIKLRKMKPDDRSEEEALLDTYKAALGMA